MSRSWSLFYSSLYWTFFVLSSAVFFIIAVIIRVLTTPFDKNLRVLHQFSCFWAALYIWVSPFWWAKIRGKDNVDRKQAYVIVSNHQSMVDILVIYKSFLHFKWVSKKSMFKAPFLGWNMWLNKYVGIERGEATSREKCLAECRDWLALGSSVVFFPAGTRSKRGEVGRFKIGAFRVAVETGMPLLPMVIHGSRDALPKHTIALNRRSRMTLTILPPIPVEKVPADQVADAAEKLAQQCHDLIEAKFNADSVQA